MKKFTFLTAFFFLSLSLFSQTYEETMGLDLSLKSGNCGAFYCGVDSSKTFSSSQELTLLKSANISLFEGFDDFDTEPELTKLQYTIVHMYTIMVNKAVFWRGRMPFRKVHLVEGTYTITHSVTITLLPSAGVIKSFAFYNTNQSGVLCEYN